MTYREVALMREEGIEEGKATEREGRQGLSPKHNGLQCRPATPHRATFCLLKHARSSYKPAIFMGSGVLVDASSEVLGKEDWALVVGGGRVRGTGSKGSGGGTWLEWLDR